MADFLVTKGIRSTIKPLTAAYYNNAGYRVRTALTVAITEIVTDEHGTGSVDI